MKNILTYIGEYSINKIPHRLDLLIKPDFWTDFWERKNQQIGGCPVVSTRSKRNFWFLSDSFGDKNFKSYLLVSTTPATQVSLIMLTSVAPSIILQSFAKNSTCWFSLFDHVNEKKTTSPSFKLVGVIGSDDSASLWREIEKVGLKSATEETVFSPPSVWLLTSLSSVIVKSSDSILIFKK